MPLAKRATVNQDFSATRGKQVINEFERGGFAGAAAAEEYKSFATFNFEGEVDEIMPDKGMVRIVTTIFGRPTPLELEYWQIEKL